MARLALLKRALRRGGAKFPDRDQKLKHQPLFNSHLLKTGEFVRDHENSVRVNTLALEFALAIKSEARDCPSKSRPSNGDQAALAIRSAAFGLRHDAVLMPSPERPSRFKSRLARRSPNAKRRTPKSSYFESFVTGKNLLSKSQFPRMARSDSESTNRRFPVSPRLSSSGHNSPAHFTRTKERQ